jgi:hypothetical protein
MAPNPTLDDKRPGWAPGFGETDSGALQQPENYVSVVPVIRHGVFFTSRRSLASVMSFCGEVNAGKQ